MSDNSRVWRFSVGCVAACVTTAGLCAVGSTWDLSADLQPLAREKMALVRGGEATVPLPPCDVNSIRRTQFCAIETGIYGECAGKKNKADCQGAGGCSRCGNSQTDPLEYYWTDSKPWTNRKDGEDITPGGCGFHFDAPNCDWVFVPAPPPNPNPGVGTSQCKCVGNIGNTPCDRIVQKIKGGCSPVK